MTTISAAILWDKLKSAGRRDFMVSPDQAVGFDGLEQAVRHWLRHFDELGLTEGDRIVIRTASEPAMVSCFIAALLDGVIPVTLTADTPDVRAGAVCASVRAACAVLDAPAEADFAAKTIVLEAAAPRRNAWFGKRSAVDAVSRLAGPVATRQPRLPDDNAGLAYILFTSGTTASPSGVMISRGNLFANLATLSRLFGYSEKSRIFNDMILAHADGMIQGPLLALTNGCAVIRSGGFTLPGIETWLNRVRQQRATHVITVPTVWAMIDAYAQHDDYFDAAECQLLISVAARLPDDLWSRLETRFRRPLCNQYGLTETVASALYAGSCSEMGPVGTIGLPVDCEARIAPGSTPPDEGELQLRGDNVFPGYWEDAVRTAATFTADGWMKTGDLARRQGDGSYAILGRLKLVIMMGGFLIRPDEIDEAMLACPGVEESVTVAVEDELFGEVPFTAVVCSRPITETELTAHARHRLESRKVPKRIVSVDAIPRGISGKPNIAEVRALLLGRTRAPAMDSSADLGVAETVLSVAADVFRVLPGALTVASAPGDVAGWDSFSQLNFLMAVEERFKITIPASRIAAIRSIGDMVAAVKSAQG